MTGARATMPVHASRESRVALVTCRELPEADPDTRLLIEPLAMRGVSAVPVVWDDSHVDWDAFDLAIVRSCWDYASRRGEFLSWAGSVPRLENRFPILEWNTDKRYLTDLLTLGIPVIPTTWVRPDDDYRVPAPNGATVCVIKPAVSLSALDTGRYDLIDPHQCRMAEDHIRRLQRAGRTVMVQPYMSQIDRAGETSLVFIGGRFSHAIRKGAVLDGPDQGADKRFAPDGGLDLRRWAPSSAELALAKRALGAALGGGDHPLYARVDLVPNAEGAPVVMELELTEPTLFFAAVPEAIGRFVQAIVERVRRSRGSSTGKSQLIRENDNGFAGSGHDGHA